MIQRSIKIARRVDPAPSADETKALFRIGDRVRMAFTSGLDDYRAQTGTIIGLGYNSQQYRVRSDQTGHIEIVHQ